MSKITAVFCAFGFFFSAGCQQQTTDLAWLQGEQERVSLSSQVEIRKLRLEGISTNGSPEDLERLLTQHASLMQQKKHLEYLRNSLQREIARLESSCADAALAVEADIRAKACGRFYATFALPSGRQFTKVNIVSINDEGVLIRHEGGLARLGYQELSSEQREAFALSEHKSRQAAKMLAVSEAFHERTMHVHEAQAAASDKKDAGTVPPSLPDLASLPLREETTKRTGPLAQGPKTFGNPNRIRRPRPCSVYRGPSVYYYYREVKPAAQAPSSAPSTPNH